MTAKQTKAIALIQLIRPELPVAAGVCVVVGQVIGLGGFPAHALAAFGFALGLFLSASQMVFNDLFDLDVDRVNMPARPLPSGRVTPREAAALGLALAVVGLGLAWAIHPAAFGISLLLWALGFLYNWKLKAAGLWGNLIVSANVAATILLGGASVGRLGSPLVLLFGAVVGLFDLAEEIAGDAMDMAGDEKRGSRSLAIMHGRAAALRVSGLLFAGVVALTLLPAPWGERRLVFWLPILLMDGVIAFFTARLLRSRTPEEGRAAMRAMYLSATLGLAAFVLAAFMG